MSSEPNSKVGGYYPVTDDWFHHPVGEPTIVMNSMIMLF